MTRRPIHAFIARAEIAVAFPLLILSTCTTFVPCIHPAHPNHIKYCYPLFFFNSAGLLLCAVTS
ncbi:hypothetical protein JAAARDRAFT_28008 [Jaapia argillacea MUCL 33604]|uniref:Uncharacterized protein n=1 Tax=Jaapia argillacea MUCL 33604 TaxID=933084 RepID=A0A067QBN4_9AGAM|nr:hypothetical protein JAAARDRAFT_28008 [Jaapia argillacea MUCL 33604]